MAILSSLEPLSSKTYDLLLAKLEDLILQIQTAHSGVVKLAKAKRDFFSHAAKVRVFLDDVLQTRDDRCIMAAIFGGDCDRLLRTRIVLDAARSSTKGCDEQITMCVSACDAVEKILQDIGMYMKPCRSERGSMSEASRPRWSEINCPSLLLCPSWDDCEIVETKEEVQLGDEVQMLSPNSDDCKMVEIREDESLVTDEDVLAVIVPEAIPMRRGDESLVTDEDSLTIVRKHIPKTEAIPMRRGDESLVIDEDAPTLEKEAIPMRRGNGSLVADKDALTPEKETISMRRGDEPLVTDEGALTPERETIPMRRGDELLVTDEGVLTPEKEATPVCRGDESLVPDEDVLTPEKETTPTCLGDESLVPYEDVLTPAKEVITMRRGNESLVTDEVVLTVIKKGVPEDLHKRVLTRAYFLWQNGSGSCEKTNYFEALRIELSLDLHYHD